MATGRSMRIVGLAFCLPDGVCIACLLDKVECLRMRLKVVRNNGIDFITLHFFHW